MYVLNGPREDEEEEEAQVGQDGFAVPPTMKKQNYNDVYQDIRKNDQEKKEEKSQTMKDLMNTNKQNPVEYQKKQIMNQQQLIESLHEVTWGFDEDAVYFGKNHDY